MTQHIQIVGDPKKPRVFAAQTTVGRFVVGDFLPDPANPQAQEVRIAEIFKNDDGSIDVYGLPVLPDSPFRGSGLIITVSNLHVIQTWTAARVDLWQELQREQSDEMVARLVALWTGLPPNLVAEHLEDLRVELEGEEEEEEEEVPPASAGGPTDPAPAPAPVPAANGIPSSS